MRIYPCLLQDNNRPFLTSSLLVYRIIEFSSDTKGDDDDFIQMTLISIKTIIYHSKLQYINSVNEIAQDSIIQSLALNRTRRLFFCIVSKDQEYDSCRSTPLVNSSRSAGVPPCSGAVHEFA